ncbi:MAG: hypothetical protein L0387_21555 [Acidobacteria bacterium]|nr:hypothetical protein [Acidobacteriota bacterium]
MRTVAFLVAILLFCVLPAAAQDDPVTAGGAMFNLAVLRTHAMGEPAPALRLGTPEPLPQRFPTPDEFSWQVSFSYAYTHLRFPGNARNMNGFSTSIIRYTNDWFGLEGNVTGTFNSLPGNARGKYIFYGGGMHIAWRNSTRLDPFGRVLVGGARVLPQTALGSANTLAYVAGAGVDWKLTGRLYLRVAGDYFGTRLFSQSQNNYQATAGVVVNF